MAVLELLYEMERPSWSTILLAASGLYLLSLVITGIYNIYFHPLAKFPGPKIAVIGPWYEFFYDVIKDGRYLWQIEKMHEKYGPIVRVNAREIHIKDATFYSSVYTGSSRKVNKDPHAVGAFDVPTATAATVDHDTHRARRGYLNQYFSKRAVSTVEPIVQERLDKLCTRVDDKLKTGELLSLDGCFSALTADVITRLFYGYSFDYLAVPDFHFVIRDAFLGLSLVFHMARFFPLVIWALKSMPIPIIRLIMPPVADLLEMRDGIKVNGFDNAHNGKGGGKENKSVIAETLKDTNIPAAERTVDRLVDEGTVILFAGTETTSRSLAVTMYYLLTNPDILARVRHELETSLPLNEDHHYSLAQLEKLPYFGGVIHEGFRLSFGPVGRLPRIATEDFIKYGDYNIPPGTPVSLSTYFVHTDEKVYPDPYKFDPERWIRASEQGVNLTKYITNFSKGSRVCLGINMAYAEFYMTLARIVLKYDMELYDTTDADVELYHARIVGYPKKSDNPTRGEIIVKITGKREMAKAM